MNTFVLYRGVEQWLARYFGLVEVACSIHAPASKKTINNKTT